LRSHTYAQAGTFQIRAVVAATVSAASGSKTATAYASVVVP
jgi:hypothetical protein